MEWLQKLKHYLLHRKRRGGLIFENIGDGASPKFKKYAEENAKDIFGAVLPNSFGDDLLRKNPKELFTFQGSILSCMSAATVELKGSHTNYEKFFSWRDIYGRISHYNGGTRLKDNLRAAQEGILYDSVLPQRNYWGGEFRMQTIWKWTGLNWRRPTTEEDVEMSNSRQENTLGGWSYIYTKNITAVKHAIMNHKYLLAGLYVQSGNWHNNGTIHWNKNKQGSYGHGIGLIGWNDSLKCYYVADHDNKPIKKLSYYYPFAFIVAVNDGKSKGVKTMLRVIKKADSPDYYVVWLDGTKSHLSSWDMYLWMVKKGICVDNDKIEIVKEEEFNRIVTDDKSNHLIRIIDEFNQATK